MNIQGLIIDPQVDFCDPHGALFVAGADGDMVRLARLLGKVGDKITALHVTLDSHHAVHIAHPLWWQNKAGNPPAPFTIITLAEVEAGMWRVAQPDTEERTRAYLRGLQEHGRYPLCVWPYHCLIGSAGHAVAPVLFESLRAWEGTGPNGFRVVHYVPKGDNLYTEHYSALRADVPDLSDPNTLPNLPLVQQLESADLVLIAGEAGSHCVANTVRDLVELSEDKDLAKRLVLVSDAVSPVGGFEAYQAQFIRDLTGKGMRVVSASEVPALLG
jgi:nicotinamidase-related amidase